MAPSNEALSVPPTLKAEYLRPGVSQSFSHPLPSISRTAPTKEKTTFLSALRTSVVKLQEEVNEYLTARMEEDRATAATHGAKLDENKEEENYGEEVVEDEN